MNNTNKKPKTDKLTRRFTQEEYEYLYRVLKVQKNELAKKLLIKFK